MDVTIILPAYNAEATLAEALESLQAQTHADWEAIVVDDGSTDRTPEIAARFAAGDRRLHVVRQANAGEGAARNTGLARTRSDWVTFLDADDWLLPAYLDRMLSVAAKAPEPDIVYCGWIRVTDRNEQGPAEFAPEPSDLFPALARSNRLPIHACLVRRSLVDSVGRFDVTLATCPDWDLWQRIFRRGPRVASIREVLVRYRLRAGSAGTDARQILQDGLTIIARGHRRDPRVAHPVPAYAEGIPEEQAGEANLTLACWAAGLAIGQGEPAAPLLRLVADHRPRSLSAGLVADSLLAAVPISAGRLVAAWAQMWPHAAPRIDAFLTALEAHTGISGLAAESKALLMQGVLDCALPSRSETPTPGPDSGPRLSTPPRRPSPFGEPRSVEPVSREWGYDRGLPVDRYYIERFLARQRDDVRGRVLEVGDRGYTRRFGEDRVARSDVLHVAPGNREATLVGDLAHADHIPADTFDCIILTQTLQLVYDLPAAVRTVHRILKPGGVLLATFPGLTRSSRTEWPGSWFWRLTPDSARRLFEAVFPPRDLRVASHGNVLAACAFLYGLATEELDADELDHEDPDYDVTVTVRAVKAESPRMRGDSGRATKPGRGETSSPPAAEVLVLLYHRIQDYMLDPWQLSVSPDRFDEQMRGLSEHATVVRLPQAMQEVARERPDRPLVAITFDDGYADNLYQALPRLEKHGLPATVFVCTGPVAQRAEFWWDMLERLLLWPTPLPANLEIPIGDQTFRWELGDAADYPASTARLHAGWRAWEPPPTPRHELYATLWQRLHDLDADQRAHVLAALRAWSGRAADSQPRYRALGPVELRKLASNSLVEIGAHTVTHPSLARLPLLQQQAEIAGSRAWLEGLLGQSVASFSYPFGKGNDYTPETIGLVRDAGFACGCSNISGSARSGSDPFQLPRLPVSNMTADAFARQLQTWAAP